VVYIPSEEKSRKCSRCAQGRIVDSEDVRKEACDDVKVQRCPKAVSNAFLLMQQAQIGDQRSKARLQVVLMVFAAQQQCTVEFGTEFICKVIWQFEDQIYLVSTRWIINGKYFPELIGNS
jgi:hypothetical protein